MASSAASRPLGELGPSAEPAGALRSSFKGATEASPEVGPAFHALALPSLSSSPCPSVVRPATAMIFRSTQMESCRVKSNSSTKLVLSHNNRRGASALSD